MKFSIENYTHTVGNKNEIDGLMRIVLVLQRFFGQHILNPDWTWKRFCLYQLATFALFLYVLAGTFAILKETDDIKMIAEATYTLVVTGVSFIKYCIITSKRFVFRKLYVELKSSLYDIVRDDSEEKMKKVFDDGKKSVYYIFFFALCTIIMYTARVMWCNLQGQKVTLSLTTSILMPMETPYYQLGLILHSIYFIEVCFIIIQVDMWLVLFVFFFCVTSDITLKILTVEKRRQGENRIEYAVRLNDSLKRFYRLHVKQVNFLSMLNDTFKWITVVIQVNICICICTVLLLVQKGAESAFAVNILHSIAELIGFSWLGEQIKTKTNNWKMALLDFDWTNLQQKDKRSYYILMCYMNQEFGLQSAIGGDLVLITVSKVLKFSYQVYTVLQSM
uniref:Odorant receptor n=1 Tax=Conogethes pinicolalis TaxID=1178461 RepID=A0A5B9GA10_9NEOP|nr:odorant receptor 32 [Conogethes pinicolalis]